jgi:hypothetical protein
VSAPELRVVPDDADSELHAWARRIKLAQRKSVEAVLHLGRELIAAREANPGEWVRLFSDQPNCISDPVPFSYRKATRLIAIVENSILSDGTRVSHLPAAWSTLYELSQIEPDVLNDLIARGLVHPEMERDEATRLREFPISPAEMITRLTAMFGGNEMLHAAISERRRETRESVQDTIQSLWEDVESGRLDPATWKPTPSPHATPFKTLAVHFKNRQDIEAFASLIYRLDEPVKFDPDVAVRAVIRTAQAVASKCATTKPLIDALRAEADALEAYQAIATAAQPEAPAESTTATKTAAAPGAATSGGAAPTLASVR